MLFSCLTAILFEVIQCQALSGFGLPLASSCSVFFCIWVVCLPTAVSLSKFEIILLRWEFPLVTLYDFIFQYYGVPLDLISFFLSEHERTSFWVIACLKVLGCFLDFWGLNFVSSLSKNLLSQSGVMFPSLLMQGVICSFLLIHWCIQKKQKPQLRHALSLNLFLICW